MQRSSGAARPPRLRTLFDALEVRRGSDPLHGEATCLLCGPYPRHFPKAAGLGRIRAVAVPLIRPSDAPPGRSARTLKASTRRKEAPPISSSVDTRFSPRPSFFILYSRAL